MSARSWAEKCLLDDSWRRRHQAKIILVLLEALEILAAEDNTEARHRARKALNQADEIAKGVVHV